MKSTAIFISLIGFLQSTKCEGGGSSTYGYDASSVCSRPYNFRASRAYLENLPCDFRQQNWCTVAGNTYPWHAVRRFVQENQGLMRRMYGIERHIDILKEEFEKNDIELEYDDRYERYLDETRRHRSDFDTLGYNDEDDLLGKRYRGAGTTRTRKTLKKNHDSVKSRFRKSRANEGLTTSTPTTEADASEETNATTVSFAKKETVVAEDNLTTTTQTATAVMDSTTNVEKVTVEVDDMNEDKQETTIIYEENQEDYKLNYITTVPAADSINTIHNLSINEIPGQIDRLDTNIDELTEISEDEGSNVEEVMLDGSDVKEVSETSTNLNRENISSTKKPLPEMQQFRPRPEYKPAENKHSTTTKPENADTQHYHQEIDSKNQHRETVLKLRGVNACPVKDEVVAPLWANNTRGEILALINHYPFEQYVHWEKCTHENKQMYCRDGCRCEQQYRLHRLLAFDPSNECRGIFSDWFKFPSCCVCRCYDLPLEFRVTSRSPRLLKRKIKIRTPRY